MRSSNRHGMITLARIATRQRPTMTLRYMNSVLASPWRRWSSGPTPSPTPSRFSSTTKGLGWDGRGELADFPGAHGPAFEPVPDSSGVGQYVQSDDKISSQSA